MSPIPDLKFGPEGSTTGFTPVGLASFSDLRPAAVVRELIQNSLDAAVVEANRSCAYVRFCRYESRVEDIPGIRSYRRAFKRALKTQKKLANNGLPRAAALVVEKIQSALNQDSHIVLAIIDNGIGLDLKRMSALLSDGISAKTSGSSGTFGNGHSVSIPASNLRYILYGGITEEGIKIGAGHAVIATHQIPRQTFPASAHGYYITGFHSRRDGRLYDFPTDNALPDMISENLVFINEEFDEGTGTVVLIPCFNNFEESDSLWDMVSKAAACNFFQAIYDEKLVIEVEDLTDESYFKTLEKRNLSEILEHHIGEQRRGRKTSFLTGRKSNEVFEVLTNGKTHYINTSAGELQVRLYFSDKNQTRINVCRNGMWITEDVPGLRKATFNELQPFQLLILLDRDNRTRFYDLVRESETPLHDEINLKQLGKSQIQEFRQAITDIVAWLRDEVPSIENDSYSPDDVLALEFIGAESGGSGSGRLSYWGTPSVRTAQSFDPWSDKSHNELEQGRGGNVNGRKNPNVRNTSGSRSIRRSRFHVVAVPIDQKRHHFLVECHGDCINAEFRVFVDENLDATCDGQLRTNAIPVKLSSIAVDSERVSSNSCIFVESEVVGVRLGVVTAGMSFTVDANVNVPDSILLPKGYRPTLRVEVSQSVDPIV